MFENLQFSFLLLIMLNFFLFIFLNLLSIAFFTIMERKLLGLFHIRLGPDKLMFFGLFQPFSDFLKLFTKMNLYNFKIFKSFFILPPIFINLIFFFCFMFFPIFMELNNFFLNMMLIIFVLSLPIFFHLMSSFFSFSKFSILSSKRIICQLISYEIIFMLLMIFFIPFSLKMNIEIFKNYMNELMYFKYFLSLVMFILILSESSRTPFDFIESESELVSGINIEFSGILFSFFFLYEYGMMVFFSIYLSFLMLKFYFFLIMMFLFIFIRASFPRIRYDKMMMFFWKILIFFSISIMFSNLIN